ncbi:hypothetical protein [Psychrobacter sp. W2-37-MNA-CIBAN-0211]|uniref:hypothetical protein n=1 Tax=Psychrobacter sp. W2-37-MNA-CIBAN-0211 TaxID=3140443 RepID=UPI003318763D
MRWLVPNRNRKSPSINLDGLFLVCELDQLPRVYRSSAIRYYLTTGTPPAVLASTRYTDTIIKRLWIKEMADPIIFKTTEAGKQAALQALNDSTKILIDLTHVAVGRSKYTPTGNETSLKNEAVRSDIVSGEVVDNTLRFSSTIYASEVTPVYEMGILTRTGVLFAVAASNTTPLVTVYPDIAFVASFGISINDINAGSITVSTDIDSNIAPVLMQNHLATPNPHPQYVSVERFQFLLDVMFPIGYIHYSHSATNPKSDFDELLGTNTKWRRLNGKIIVATDPNDNYIKDVGLTLGQKGMTTLASSNERPHVYPLHTTNIFERYDASTEVETVWQVTANKINVNEGASVRFTVSANNLPDGQGLAWTIKEGSLNSASNDISQPDNTETGSVTLNNASAIIDYMTTAEDNDIESQKHVRLTLGAPANLSINVPINDAGKTETAIHIISSSSTGIVLDEYYKQQSGAYPQENDKIRFIVDAGVDIIAPNTNTPAMIEGANWATGAEIIVENRGRILGHGGDGGRSAYQYKFWNDGGDIISPSRSLMRNPNVGGDGGTAIKSTTRSILVENHNIIAGGGGGGGGLGAYRTAGSYNFVIGGGGTGGGAPLGKRSPNEGTYSMYLEDTTATGKKLFIPTDDYFRVFFQKVDGSQANGSGSAGDYTYAAEYNAPNLEETRAIDLEISSTSDVRASAGFKDYRIAAIAGYIVNRALILKMSQPATIEAKGSGGANIAASPTAYPSASQDPYPEGDQPTLTRGGDGGLHGQNGQSGTFDKIYSYNGEGEATETTSDNTSWYISPAAGGLAGYVKQGSVTITNFSGGTSKGRS